MVIVMKTTIDYLVSNQMAQDLDRLMGHNLPWEQNETKTNEQYFKLNEDE